VEYEDKAKKARGNGRAPQRHGFRSFLRHRVDEATCQPWEVSTAKRRLLNPKPKLFFHRSSSSSRFMATTFERDFQSLPVLRYDDLVHDFEGFVQDLNSACVNVGFFVLADLPASLSALNAEVLRTGRQFFALPAEEKSRIDYRSSPHFRGYMWQGVENTAGQRDEREQIEFGREEPACLGPDASQLFQRLRGPNQWPDRPVELRSTMSAWFVEMECLARQLTRALSSSLGLKAEALDKLFNEPHIQAKLVHYPAPSTETEESLGMGVGGHSDSGFLTLLLQDDVGGLEVLNSAGKWVPAVPMPNSIVCNLGEVVQLLSGGEYLSTVHRVQRPQRGRISAPYFWNPSLDATIEPLVLPGHDVKRTVLEAQRPGPAVNQLISSYGMNAFKSLARSHPEVFARHHADLLCLPNGQVVLR